MKARLTRVVHFSASHRLHNPSLSDDENRTLYGKCNHPNGHGHDYFVHVTVEGDVDPVTGMVMNLFDLDALLAREVVERFHYRSMDQALEPFGGWVSTAENVARAVWQVLDGKLPTGVTLTQVHIGETLKNAVEYDGEGIGTRGL